MKTTFDPSWKNWIQSNIDAGCDKAGIFKILLDEGYTFNAIKKEMNYAPSISTDLIVNPLKGQQTRQKENNNFGSKINPKSLYIANSTKTATNKAEHYVLDNFLNTDECQQIIDIIKSKKLPSTLSSSEEDKLFRTSSTCQLGQMESDLIKDIDLRICKVMGIDPSYSEVIQGQYYEIGQEFKPHTDFFEANEIENHGSQMGQRTYTFMIYLNDVEAGGETVFPKLEQSITPKLGTAVIWNSLNSDGSTNHNTLHHAMPISSGYKAVITKWFRSNSNLPSKPPMFSKEPNEYLPNHTKVGFAKSSLSKELYQQLVHFYDDGNAKIQLEHVPGDFIFNENRNENSSSIIELSQALRDKVHDELKPLLEKWCGESLEPTFVYGIRTYHHGAILKSHRDRLETHIISAIINIEQDVNEPWPLVIDDNYYRSNEVFITPQEVIMYEGARLLHGRPIALNGKSFQVYSAILGQQARAKNSKLKFNF